MNISASQAVDEPLEGLMASNPYYSQCSLGELSITHGLSHREPPTKSSPPWFIGIANLDFQILQSVFTF